MIYDVTYFVTDTYSGSNQQQVDSNLCGENKFSFPFHWTSKFPIFSIFQESNQSNVVARTAVPKQKNTFSHQKLIGRSNENNNNDFHSEVCAGPM